MTHALLLNNSIASQEKHLIHEENTCHVWASVRPHMQLARDSHRAAARWLALVSTMCSYIPVCEEWTLALPGPFTVHGVSWGSSRRAAAVSPLVWAATC